MSWTPTIVRPGPVRLPVFETLAAALRQIWESRESYWRLAKGPIVLVLIADAIFRLIPSGTQLAGSEDAVSSATNALADLSPLMALSQQGVLVLLLVPFAVALYRTVLLGGNGDEPSSADRWSSRETLFAYWSMGLFLLVQGVGFVATRALLAEAKPAYSDMAVLAVIPCQYVAARLALVLPTAAIDGKASMPGAWALSTENGWRLFWVTVLGGLCVWGVLGVLTLPLTPWLTAEYKPAIVEVGLWLSRSIGFMAQMIVEVTVLSFCYRFLSRPRRRELGTVDLRS